MHPIVSDIQYDVAKSYKNDQQTLQYTKYQPRL